MDLEAEAVTHECQLKHLQGKERNESWDTNDFDDFEIGGKNEEP